LVNISFGEVGQRVLVALGILKTVLRLDPFKFIPPALQEFDFSKAVVSVGKIWSRAGGKICGFCPGRFSEWRIRFI
jgi:hypothetical protein